ncbi:hypothetical protein MMC18_005856 [Xylographa bjoerkii]|nr:hypothetical protein [Xylographa bjoerkii]
MTKRTLDETSEVSEPSLKHRKRQAFTAPRDALTKSIIKRNAAESPLLTLPLEIRRRIWREVLGDHQVHIVRMYVRREPQAPMTLRDIILRVANEEPDEILRHYLCVQGKSQTAVYQQWKTDMEEGSARRVSQEDHESDCMIDYSDKNHACAAAGCHNRSGRTLQLALLRACRQIYVEANESLWSTNIFSFGDSKLFKNFIDRRNSTQKKLLKKIHLNWTGHNVPHGRDYAAPLLLSTIRTLRGLRVMHLNMLRYFPEESSKSYIESEWNSNFRTVDVLVFSNLPLQVVTVTFDISNNSRTAHVGLPPAKRLEMAEGIRTLLLDPDGPKVYAELVRKLKRT